jgi:branched-chain amino acid aminotransferase
MFDLADRGLLLADGLFETILVTRGRPFLFDQHLARLARGCTTLGIVCDLDTARQAVGDLVDVDPADAVIRVTVTRGVGQRGLQPTEGAEPTIFASRSGWNAGMAFTSPSLTVSAIRRNAMSPLSRIKSLSYLDNVLALVEAQEKGADDALLLSTDGDVACTSAANVFMIESNDLVTPPLSVGVLDGTMRALVLEMAGTLRLRPREEAFDVARLATSDGVFLTNSVRLLMSPRSLDGEPLSRRAASKIADVAKAIRSAVLC